VWLDPRIAAGYARGHFEGRYERDGVPVRRWTADLYLEDFGDDAKSVFPE
jgi:hypothetical protein